MKPAAHVAGIERIVELSQGRGGYEFDVTVEGRPEPVRVHIAWHLVGPDVPYLAVLSEACKFARARAGVLA